MKQPSKRRKRATRKTAPPRSTGHRKRFTAKFIDETDVGGGFQIIGTECPRKGS